jgi:hypothetical protein
MVEVVVVLARRVPLAEETVAGEMSMMAIAAVGRLPLVLATAYGRSRGGAAAPRAM